MTRRIAAFAVDRLRFGCHLRRLHAASRLFRSISRMSFTALGVPLPGAALGRSADELNSLVIACSVQLTFIVAITDCSAGKRTNSTPDRWRANGRASALSRMAFAWRQTATQFQREPSEQAIAKQIHPLRGPASPCRAAIENKGPHSGSF